MEADTLATYPNHWTVKSVGDVCQRVTSGGTPSRKNPSYYMNGIWPWVKTQELKDTWIDNTEEFITETAVRESSAKVLPENTVLVAMYGATVGQLGILRRPMTCNQACCALIADENVANYRFLFYRLLSSRALLKRLATGAAQQNLSGAVIRALRFPFPPIAEQRRIAHILGTLDDKIELNRRMAATLEEMARALFKSWFVDFNPVRAKAEGRPTGLPPDIDALFPDELVESELGLIPKG
jgi:type I restriction enzyme S subunit